MLSKDPSSQSSTSKLSLPHHQQYDISMQDFNIEHSNRIYQPYYNSPITTTNILNESIHGTTSFISSPDHYNLNDGTSGRSNKSNSSQQALLSPFLPSSPPKTARNNSQLDVFEDRLQNLKADESKDQTSEIYKKQEIWKSACCGFGVAVVSAIVLGVMACFVVYYLESYRIDSNRRMGYEKVELVERNIGKQLIKTFNSLLVMKDQVHNWNYSITLERFNGLSGRLSWGHPEVYNFEYAIGPNSSLDYIYPPVQAAYGLQMGLDTPTHKAAMNEAIQKNETTIYGPIELIEGGIAVIAQHPIFYLNGSFFGFAVELCSVDQLFNSINFTGIVQGYEYQLFDYYRNSVFLQRLDGYSEFEPTFDRNVSIISDSIYTNISVYNCRWKIILRPVAGWDANSILWLEIIIALLFVVLPSMAIGTLSSVVFSSCNSLGNHGKVVEILNQVRKQHEEKEKKKAKLKEDWDTCCDYVKERTEKIQRIINNLPMPAISASMDGKIISINSALTSYFGYDAEGIQDIKLKDMFENFSIKEIRESRKDNHTFKHSTFIISTNQTTHQVETNILFYGNECVLICIPFSQ